ncbi:hypothetical protein N9A94_04200 [Akkermansiaceae bacterium]|nr:hypothetical protein [Akkermansiaceae bacterium]
MKILIVSPHFPPTNAPDMQRVRMILPYLAEAGISAEVLAVNPTQVAAPEDPWLVEGLPDNIPVHRVDALDLSWRKIPGLGTLSLRAKRGLQKKGDALLQKGEFDLVYFSTTQWTIHSLGPRWKKRFGVPFAMDYQDPWITDYYRENPQVTPPGGRLKYWLSQRLNVFHEPRVIRECLGFTSVSPAYPKQLARRYGETPPSLVLPFPGDRRDLDRVADTSQDLFDPADGFTHWVYVGAGGAYMESSARGIFATLQHHPKKEQLRLHFIGTSYAGAGRGEKSLEPLAADYGLADIVRESPDRIPYSTALKCLLDADGLIVPGSNDPGYTASKIYPYLLAGRPMLAVFHEESSVTDLIKSVGGGTLVDFNSQTTTEQLAKKIRTTAFDKNGDLTKVPLDEEAFVPYDARSQAQKLSQFFQTCLQEPA